jgi:hypothetical protein
MRWPQPSHAATLLVDQDRRVVPPDALAQRGDKLADLVGRATIAAEQDEADRIGGGEEIALEGVQALAGAAENDRARRIIGQ